jgi:hypothetical protein
MPLSGRPCQRPVNLARPRPFSRNEASPSEAHIGFLDLGHRLVRRKNSVIDRNVDSRFVAAYATVGPCANALDHTAMDLPGGEQRVGRAAVVDGDMVEDLDHPGIRVDLSARTSATHSPTNRALATGRSRTTVPGITQFGSMLPICR